MKKTTIDFSITPEELQYLGGEGIFATKLEDGTYRLDGVPIMKMGVSFNDIVEVEPSSDGRLRFKRVLQSSGHATFRLVVPKRSERFREAVRELQHIGCVVWGHRDFSTAFTVDAPPAVVEKARKQLRVGRARDLWSLTEMNVPPHDVEITVERLTDDQPQ